MFVLTLLAALGASAAPWFLAWAQAGVAASDIAASPATQRVVNVSGAADHRPGALSPLSVVREQVERSLPIPGRQVAAGGRVTENVGAIAVASHPIVELTVAARDGVCAELVVEGACPDTAGTVMLGRATATALTVHIGEPVAIGTVLQGQPVILRISGIYEPRDVLSPYWVGTNLLGSSADQAPPAAFVSESTLFGLPADRVTVDAHVLLPPSAFHDSGNDLARQLSRARFDLGPQGFGLLTDAGLLISQIRRDQQLVRDAVVVATVELLLVSWFALFLTVRQASLVRRFDIGLLKLRGAPRWQIGWLTGQQSAIPMLAGVAVGALGGYLAAVALAGSTPPVTLSTVETSVLMAVLVGGGALAAAVAAEWSVLRSSVVGLLRRVPTRRSGWRAPVGDLAIVVLALAGVYQAHADLGARDEASILSLLAPGLVGLALALVAARLMPWLAVRAGAGALAAGHAGSALAALHVARRPGTERVFAVIAVAVSVLATTFFFAANAQGAWDERAELELGAPRVLQVRAPNSTALLTAVRAADPAGRAAMAVARSNGSPTVAVDTTRLAAVVLLPAGYGLPEATALARLLRPAPPGAVTLRDGPLHVDLDGPDPTAAGSTDPAGALLPVSLRIAFADPAGAWHTAQVGPVAAGRRRYDTVISGCPDGCRLISFEPLTSRAEASIGVRGLSQSAGLLDGAALGDIARWRSQLGADSIGPTVAAHHAVLDIEVTAGSSAPGRRPDNRVFYAGTPNPVPVAMAGTVPGDQRPGDPRITVLGADDVPYQRVATGTVLPGLGTPGALMDLEYAQASLSSAKEAVSLEVWLAAGASPAIVDSLRSRGIQLQADRTLSSAVAAWAAEGPGLALRFQLLAALVVLLLAGGAVVMSSTADAGERGRELAALRQQGMPERSMRFAGQLAPVGMVTGAVLVGLVAALIGQRVAAASLPVFTDGWAVLPHVSGARPIPAVLALGLAVLVLVPAAALGAARLVRSVGRSMGAKR